jgi:branched-chain amino acid transport system substrate-binding protein
MISVRSKRALTLVCALALTAGACSSDDDDSASTTAAPESTEAAADTTEAAADTTEAAADTTEAAADTTEAAAEAGPLGEENPADSSLEPFKVGYMWSGVSASVDNSSDEQSADAVTQWINEYGGGVAGGHPLELVKCAAPDAATAATCGSTMLESGVTAVLFNVIGDVEPWATPVIGAGIPIFAFSSADASLMGAGGHVFTLSNPTASLGLFPAKVALEVGAENSAVVVIDVPGATGPVQALVPPTFEALGAGSVDLVPISPTAPDHGPAIQVELQNNPEVVHIIGNPAFCSLTIRALKDAGYTGTISMISNCVDAPMKEQLGADLEGIKVSYTAGEDPENADYQLFKAIVEEYAPDVTPNGTPVGSFVALEGFRRVMENFAGDLASTAEITAHIAGHAALPQPTIDGGTFKCDGTAVPGVPIACTPSFTYSTLDASGNPTTFVGA